MTPGIDSGKMSYTRALDQLRQLMWHASLATTERYLRYRENRAAVTAADDDWHNHLARLAHGALQVIGGDSATN